MSDVPIRIDKHALYKGVRVFVSTERNGYFNVMTDPGCPLDADFMEDMTYGGHTEYYGRIRKDDPHLTLSE